jgi:hypothetical protein
MIHVANIIAKGIKYAMNWIQNSVWYWFTKDWRNKIIVHQTFITRHLRQKSRKAAVFKRTL